MKKLWIICLSLVAACVLLVGGDLNAEDNCADKSAGKTALKPAIKSSGKVADKPDAKLDAKLDKKPSGFSLTITISEIDAASGKISVSLFNTKKSWPKRKNAFVAKSVSAKKGKVKLVFTGLTAGSYAVSAYHDENDNGKLDKNFIGIPKEGCAASRDAKPKFGPPRFKDAVFKLSGDKEISFKMRY